MSFPRKAILLAAGYGTRMRPLSWDLPKSLMPLWGKPIIAHVLDLLREWGVHEALVNLHHQPDEIFRYLRTRDNRGVQLTFSFEPEILGTGGALDRAAFFLDDAPFWIVNTDIAMDVSPAPFVREFRRRRPLAALWLDPRRRPRTVETRRGLITNFASATPGAPGTCTFCGLHLVSPAILKWIPRGGFSSIVDAYRNAMAAGLRVSGVVVPKSFWMDLGNPEHYLDAHAATRNNHRHHLPGGRLFDWDWAAKEHWIDNEVPRSRCGRGPPGFARRLRRGTRDDMHKLGLVCHSEPTPGGEESPFRVSGNGRSNVRQLQARGVAVSGFVSIQEPVTIAPGARIVDSVLWPGARIGRHAVLNRAVVARDTAVNGALASGVAMRADRAAPHDPHLAQALARIGWRAEDTTLVPLAARGSDRTFSRLFSRGRSVILVQYGEQRSDNPRYAGHARFLLRHGVPVPRVLADLPAERTLVIQDAGDMALESLAARVPQARLERYYRATLDALIVLHAIPVRATRGLSLEPAFSRRVYAWERDLMANHLLRRRLGMKEPAIGKVMRDLETAAARLLRAPDVLVHRDLQSSNVLWHRGGPVFIDFQSMRLGPAAYDVASLLCDPYVMLEPARQSRLLEYYLARSPSPAAVRDSFWLAAVERLAQALGAYGRLAALPGMARFASHIQPALKMMSRVLEHLPGLMDLKRFVAAHSPEKTG